MAFWGEKDSFYLPKMHFLNIYLNLVSTASKRLQISEFEFYFKVASTFMSTDRFSSTKPQQKNTIEENYKKTIRQTNFHFQKHSSSGVPLLSRPLAPPCWVVNSSQTSSCKAMCQGWPRAGQALTQWSARVVFSISRREWEFLRFNLVHRDETENSWHLLSGFETRPRKNFLQSRASRRDRDLLSSLSGFETRTRIPLIWSRFSRRDREFWNLPSFPEIRLERPHYFACNFWEANYIKCRAPHFARCSPILKWPSHVLRASILWFFRLLP